MSWPNPGPPSSSSRNSAQRPRVLHLLLERGDERPELRVLGPRRAREHQVERLDLVHAEVGDPVELLLELRLGREIPHRPLTSSGLRAERNAGNPFVASDGPPLRFLDRSRANVVPLRPRSSHERVAVAARDGPVDEDDEAPTASRRPRASRSARSRGASGSTTRASSTTPAACRSSSTSRARRSRAIVDHRARRALQPRPPRRVGRRGRTPATAPASCSRSPTASCARSSTSTLPAGGRVRRRPGVPAARRRRDAEKTVARIDAIVEEEGLRVLGWRDVPDRRLDDRPDRASVMPELPAAASSTTRPARRASSSTASCSCVRKRCEHEVDGTAASTTEADGVLPVALEPHPRLQGHAHHAAARRSSSPTSPTSASSRRWRWCTAASPPTRSRRGRSRTRTAYVAHNGEINTVQGNRNWMRAREALMSTPLIPRPRARVPDHHARRVRHRQLRRVPRAAAPRRAGRSGTRVLMMIPEAWENHATMSAGEARLLPLPRVADGAVGRPGVDRVHRRHRRSARCSTATACARAATGSPTTTA